MDTRLLYVIAFGIAILSGLFYFYSGKSARLSAQKNQDLSYSATHIHLLRTDDSGQLEGVTSAEKLQYWELDGRTQLDQLQSTWYQQGKPYATFSADKAVSFNDNEKVILTGGVVAERLSTHGTAGITFQTSQLTGYPPQKRIETNQPIVIQSAQGQFSSQGLNADLNEGQFNFYRIRGQYVPASGS
ncbi:LPS export ABC transporter periplasmic protein LptC [Alkanindiges sp. WGS2144]|uniref:LPS export ABC transporter periplasmic protein LptC n=1 Tax=Alkanindiges sp. WGS2144 TaxID=3366808 RepID=UPI0037518970